MLMYKMMFIDTTRNNVMATYRVYARWPGQRVSDKTVTGSLEVAEVAYTELINRKWPATPPHGIALSENGKGLKYYDFSKGCSVVSS